MLGPNGAGKTTTILMILGLTEISNGEVRVLGFNPAREPLSVKRRVGYLPDTVGFYDNLTAADNLRYTARLIGFRPMEREKRIAAALDRVGLAEFADNQVGTFSRGMRQRLGLAEIVMKGAQIAILDETDSGLDIDALKVVAQGANSLRGPDKAILIVTHYQRLLNYIEPNFVHVMLDGRIVKTGGKELALELESKGYDWIEKEVQQPA